MKKIIKKSFSVVLAILITCAALPHGLSDIIAPLSTIFAEAASADLLDSGVFGETSNLTWEVYGNGELVISGEGATGYPEEDWPWIDYVPVITSVIIKDGITEINRPIYAYCMTSIEFPSTLTYYELDVYNWHDVETVTVDENNQYYSCDSSGVLFSKDKTQLYFFPQSNGFDSYTVPEGVTTIGEYAFYDNVNLKNIVLPDSLETIVFGAFEGCINLTSIHIPDNVHSISDSSFARCYGLREFTVGNNREFSVVNGALCSSDTVLYLPKNSTVKEYSVSDFYYIGEYAFFDCDNLEYVYIDENVFGLFPTSFACCDNLRGIIVDDANSTFCSDENGALYDKNQQMLFCWPCKSPAESIVLPDTVVSLDYYSFVGEYEADFVVNENLTDYLCSYAESEGLEPTEMVSYFFEMLYYSSFAGFVVSDSDKLFSAVDGVLYSKDKTLLLKFPIAGDKKYVEVLETAVPYIAAFCSARLEAEDGNGYYSDEQFVIIPSELTVHVPTNIIDMLLDGECAFEVISGLAGAKTVCSEISEDVAFSANETVSIYLTEDSTGFSDEYLQQVKFRVVSCADNTGSSTTGTCGENVNWTFDELTGELVISGSGNMNDYSSSSKAPWSAFSNSIKTVTVSEGVTSVGNSAFIGCENLSKVVLGSSLKSIGYSAFHSCYNLSSVHIPENVISIEYNAFGYCFNLSEITVSSINTVFFVENSALCTAEEIICLPPKSGITEYNVNNKTVRGHAFTFCDDLEYLYFGKDAYLDDDGEWIGFCPNLKAFVVDEANTQISSDENGALYDALKTTLFHWPSNSETQDIILPDTIVEFYQYAFMGEYDGVLYLNEALTETLKDDYDYAYILSLYASFKGFSVSEANQYFSVENGVLYDKDKTSLIKYPLGKDLEFYEIPQSVTQIFPQAFISAKATELPAILSGNVDDWSLRFHLPQNLTVHIPPELALLIADESQGADIINGLVGVTNVCTNISEDEIVPVNEAAQELLAAYFSDMPPESTEMLMFEVKSCEGHDISTQPQISYIEIVSLPNKTEYVLGETLDTDGLILNVSYDNGETVEITEGYTCSPTVFESLGSCCVVVSYGGFEADFEVTVEKGLPTKISIRTLPNKTEYIVGDSLILDGLTLNAECAGGFEEVITEGYNCSSSVLNNTGAQKITVTYGGCSASFRITVLNGNPVGVTIKNHPEKLKYYVGEELDTSGLVLEVEYPNSVYKTVTDGFEADCDLNSTGIKTVNVAYEENGVALETSYMVEVIAKPIRPTVSAADISVSAGETVSIPVSISNNPGFMGFSIILEYDEAVFTPVSVTAGEMLNGGTIDNSIGGTMSGGKLKVLYYADKNVSLEGTLFTVDFAVNENASGDYPVKVSYVQSDTFNENFEDVVFNCSNSTVSVNLPDDGKTRFFSESLEINAGQELCVPVYVTNANGLSDFTLTLNYNNDVLKFKNIQSDLIDDVSDGGNGTLTLICSGASITADTALAVNVVFDVAQYVESQETIIISCSSATANGESVEAICTNAEIAIINPNADKPAIIYTDGSVILKDGYVDIPVYINNNHGIMGFAMNVTYDSSLLEPVSVTKSPLISNGSFDNNIGAVPGNVKVVWNNTEDVVNNGLLYTVRFRVLDADITEIPISVSYSQADTYNENWEDVLLNIDVGPILIRREYTAQFVADGVVISTQKFTVDTESLSEPEIPQKAGYIAYWEHYELKESDIVIKAKYDLPSVFMIAKRTLNVDETTKLLPSCNFATTKRVWYSSNPSVACVDKHGNVTAIGEGECTVRVTCYGEDSFGNEIKSSSSTKIVVKEKSSAKTFKELFREAFYEFFEVTLHDIVENLKKFMLFLFRYT